MTKEEQQNVADLYFSGHLAILHTDVEYGAHVEAFEVITQDPIFTQRLYFISYRQKCDGAVFRDTIQIRRFEPEYYSEPTVFI